MSQNPSLKVLQGQKMINNLDHSGFKAFMNTIVAIKDHSALAGYLMDIIRREVPNSLWSVSISFIFRK